MDSETGKFESNPRTNLNGGELKSKRSNGKIFNPIWDQPKWWRARKD